MWADMDAGVTLHTFLRIKSHFPICSHRQSAGRTLFYTGAALHAQLSGFRVVTIFAVNVTALQKNGCPVSRTIHTAEWDDPVYYCFHLAHLSFQDVAVSCSAKSQCGRILKHGLSACQLF